MKKRLLAALLTACLTLSLSATLASAAGHRFVQVSEDPFDDWVCADCGAAISPGLKDAYEAVIARDGRTLPRDISQTEASVQAYVEAQTQSALDAVGWYTCVITGVRYTAPGGGLAGEYVYTAAIRSYGRDNPMLAEVITPPLTLIIPNLESPSQPGTPGTAGQGYWNPGYSQWWTSGTTTPDQETSTVDSGSQRSELEKLLWFAWLARRYATMPFTDVSRDSWFYPGVNYVWRSNLMSGVSETTFDPDAFAARADVWTVLARMNGYRKTGEDVWYAPSMDWAVRQGLTDGSDPLGTLTREDLAVMLWRKANGPFTPANLSQFPDRAQVSSYAESAVNWAVAKGILQGSDGLLAPQGAVTRAELATMVMRSVPGSY